MRVEDVMTRDPYTIDPEAPLGTAGSLPEAEPPLGHVHPHGTGRRTSITIGMHVS